MKLIKKILLNLLKLLFFILILFFFFALQVFIISLLKTDKENVTLMITSFGFTLTIMNLIDKFNPPTKDKTLENNSEKIINLLEDIKQNNVSTKNVAKKVKVRKIHKK